MVSSGARALGRRLLSPPAPRRYCPGPATRQPREGHAALRSLPPRRGRNAGLWSLPCSRLRHDLGEAASRAATASSGRRRRHFFLPCTWPCLRAQWPRSALPTSNVRSRRAPALAATANTARETPNAPGRRSAPGCWKSLSLLHCHRLFRLPHRAKAAAILARPSKAARGATQAAAAGAASRPHHLKRQERGREPRCGGGLGRRQKAGAELPRWRERRERRRRDAGRASDGPGLPRVSLHAPSCVRGAVCASVAPCVRHQLRSRVQKGRGVRLGPRRAGQLTG